MKGFSTVKLIIVLGLVVGIYMLITVTSKKGRSKSYRTELVNIAADEVSKVQISSPEGEVELTKEDDQWMVTLASGKKVLTKENSVPGFLSTLGTIKPGAIATRKEEKWSDYQVDSAGTRIEVFEGSKKSLDLIVGRFNMTGQRSYSTYVKLTEDDEVYTADNFMGMSLGKTTASFRENLLFRTTKDSITQITFNYPDSAFALGKVDGKWIVDGQEADSTSVATFLSGLGYVASSNFVEEENFQFPQLSIEITAGGSTYKAEAMQRMDGYVIHSDENTDGYFVDGNLFDKLFKSKEDFL